MRDLGVIMCSTLTFTEHISSIVSLAQSHYRANSILRCFVSCVRSLLMKAFNVYVRFCLQYNSVIWSSVTKQHKLRNEKVRRRFTKRLGIIISRIMNVCGE